MYNGCYTNEREIMKAKDFGTERPKQLNKDIQDLIKTTEELTIFHSGGGCEHLAYKGWLINEGIIDNGIVVDFEYDITTIKLNTILYFGDYQDDTNYSFSTTLEEGIKLIDKYNMKGEQY
jgi:hypothetical protein